MRKLNNLFNDQTASEWQCQKLNLISVLTTEGGPLCYAFSFFSHQKHSPGESQKDKRGICGKRPDFLLGNK